MYFHKLGLEISKEMRSRAEEGAAYSNLGNDYSSLVDFEEELGDRVGEGQAYCNLGTPYVGKGDITQAIEFYM